jgi:hypothetical protein
LADKLTPLILDALGRAALAPGGTPLVGTRTVSGLFPATNLGRQAAKRACEDGMLAKVLSDPPGRRELVAVTEKGREFLLEQSNPKQVLEDLVRAVEARHEQVRDLIDAARQMQAGLDAIKDVVEQILPSVSSSVAGLCEAGRGSHSRDSGEPRPASQRPATEGAAAWADDLCEHLSHWHDAAPGDCPLPELFHRLRDAHPDLTIGRFHDGLRALHDRERVYLHPWTGPLYALPEPAFALLIGHEVAYYCSLRVAVEAA